MFWERVFGLGHLMDANDLDSYDLDCRTRTGRDQGAPGLSPFEVTQAYAIEQ